jgi:hypothetical protein
MRWSSTYVFSSLFTIHFFNSGASSSENNILSVISIKNLNTFRVQLVQFPAVGCGRVVCCLRNTIGLCRAAKVDNRELFYRTRKVAMWPVRHSVTVQDKTGQDQDESRNENGWSDTKKMKEIELIHIISYILKLELQISYVWKQSLSH